MASISKTQGVEVIELVILPTSSSVTSNAFDVSTKLAATIFVHIAKTDTAGALNSGAEIRVEASAKSSGNDQWYPIQTFRTSVTAPSSEAVSATAGETELSVISTTGFSPGNIIYIQHPSVLGNSEFHRVVAVATNASVTIIDQLTNAHSGSTMYTQAEMFVAQVDLTAIGRIRVAVDGANTGRSLVVEAFMVTGDTIG